MFTQYPYLNLNDFNLDYILKTLKSLSKQLENFISLNTIKYANPIQWNITKQYEANTVVIDANDGTAYLSVQAVPTGVAITNTDYWTPIFTLNLLSANQNITLRDDGSNVLATFASVAGDWLIWNNTLYKVSRAINVNEAYVVGYNLDRYSVELFIKDYVTNIDNMIGDLDDLDTNVKSDIVSAINEVLQTITTKSIYAYPEDYGAVGDGVADDSAAVQAAVNSGKIVYLKNKYAIDSISITSPTKIIGSDDSMIYPNVVTGTILFKNVFTATANLTLENLHFEGQGRYQTTPSTRYSLINASNCDSLIIEKCTIKNIGHNYVSITEPMVNYIPLWVKAVDVLHVTIDGCSFIEGGSDELMVITPWTLAAPSKPTITFTNNTFVDCEHGASLNLFAYDVNIEHNTFNNFVYGGSVFNLTGENVTCAHNKFNGCSVGSVFDAIESCWFHAENFNVLCNNFTGSCDIFAEHDGTNAQCVGNNVEANTLFVNELTVFATANMAAMLQNTKVRSHGKCIIKNNTCKISGGNTATIRAFIINANATSDIPFADYPAQDSLIVEGNNFDYGSFFHSGNKFFINMPSNANAITLSNNVISNPNTDNLGANAKWLLYLDNRYVNRVVKSLMFVNNVVTDIDASLTNGIRLYTTMQENVNCVDVVSNISNEAYNSTVSLGSTNHTTLKEL